MKKEQIAKELLAMARELVASDYLKLNPRKVTTLAESIAEGALGWPKIADALADGYEFELTWGPGGKKVEGLEKVKGWTKWDVLKLQSAHVTSSVSVVKGRGRRKRELDKELEKLEL